MTLVVPTRYDHSAISAPPAEIRKPGLARVDTPASPSIAHDGPSHDLPEPKSSNRQDGPDKRWSTATIIAVATRFVAKDG